MMIAFMEGLNAILIMFADESLGLYPNPVATLEHGKCGCGEVTYPKQ
jgi:hypothetical protein